MKPQPTSVHPCWFLFQALAAAFLLALATGVSHGDSPQAGSAPGVADTAIGAVPSATDNATGAIPSAIDNSWVDRTHSGIERGLFATVVWFDRFFGDERVVLAERPESILRWKSELLWDEEEDYSFRSSVRASVRLPRLKDRWRLIFTSESRGDPNTIIPEDPGNPGLDPRSQVRTSSTTLIYDILRTQHSLLDAGAGVKVTIPPNAFVRTRYQHARPVGFSTLGRFTATAYWDARDGFGESNQLDFERWLALPTLLQWSNSFTIEEKNKDSGWAWGTQLSLLQKLSPKSAVTFAAGVSGSTLPAWIAQDYRVFVRYRRNVWRKWLFLEAEPDVHWPRREDGSRMPVWGATLRAEVVFAGTAPILQKDRGSGP